MTALQERIALMVRLGKYLESNQVEWIETVAHAERQNGWFTPAFIHLAAQAIAGAFLREDKLQNWINRYPPIITQGLNTDSPLIGIVMAGNIPLVGFHDFLCGYLSGARLKLKLSSKDTILWEHILHQLGNWDSGFKQQVTVSDMLRSCDAYIATGSNNSARYFEQYFQKYPHIIRKNRSSVAILDGQETSSDLEALADDVCTYFGLGCRNTTQIWVPRDYSFEHFLPAFNKYLHHIDHNKYKNNYDFQLALLLLNNVPYMTNGSVLLVSSDRIYAPISLLHYAYYDDVATIYSQLKENDQIQCISMRNALIDIYGTDPVRVKAFGDNQYPQLSDYADGVDTMQFLSDLLQKH